MMNRNETKKNRARKGILGLVMAIAVCGATVIPAAATAKAEQPKLTNAVEGVFDTISVTTIQGAKELKNSETAIAVQTAFAENKVEQIAALSPFSFGG